jgi:hypothetical protein
MRAKGASLLSWEKIASDFFDTAPSFAAAKSVVLAAYAGA